MSSLARRHWRLLTVLAGALVAAGIAAGFTFARSTSSSAAFARTARTGVVVIETSLGLQQASAAGTGMVLTPSGEVLTNNHVIRGATSIRVVVPSSGRTYSATVVGYSLTADTAVLRLKNASGLATVKLGDSAKLRIGQSVRAVGNAGGTGRLAIAGGHVTALNRALTVSDDQGGSEHLSALVGTNAALQPGDSGGPLEDSSGAVVGMDTAASLTGGFEFTQQTNGGFAIPIDRAVAVARQIEVGRQSAAVHVGGTAFLGISATPAGGFGPAGVSVEGVFSGSPADRAGLAAGDEIVALGGKAITSENALVAALLAKHPGDKITVTWLDFTGEQQTATVTLASGPPQ
jgi:S1-C subfamily serine protease